MKGFSDIQRYCEIVNKEDMRALGSEDKLMQIIQILSAKKLSERLPKVKVCIPTQSKKKKKKTEMGR